MVIRCAVIWPAAVIYGHLLSVIYGHSLRCHLASPSFIVIDCLTIE
jgi:hypothetical protein